MAEIPLNDEASRAEKLKGLLKKGLNIFRRSPNSDSKIPTEKLANEEKAQILDPWIKTGLELVKQGKFAEAIEYYEDRDIAEKLDFHFSGVFLMPIKLEEKIEEERQKLLDQCTARCNIKVHPYMPVTPEFVWSGGLNEPNMKVEIGGRTISRGLTINLAKLEPFHSSSQPIPTEMNQEVALAHVEVWVNALQMVKGGPLTGSVQDSKMDTQMYLMENGVKVSPRFASRVEKYNPLNNPNEVRLRELQNESHQENPGK